MVQKSGKRGILVFGVATGSQVADGRSGNLRSEAALRRRLCLFGNWEVMTMKILLVIVVGVCVLIAYACCVAAGRADERMKYYGTSINSTATDAADRAADQSN